MTSILNIPVPSPGGWIKPFPECNIPEEQYYESGTLYGYKVLKVCSDCVHQYHKFRLVSPSYQVHWEDGELEAHDVPDEHSLDGIHFTKGLHNEALLDYYNHIRLAYVMSSMYMYGKGNGFPIGAVVKCSLSGDVIETERGFRAQHARIVALCLFGEEHINGYWQGYQETQERAEAYLRAQKGRRARPPEWDTKYYPDEDSWLSNSGS